MITYQSKKDIKWSVNFWALRFLYCYGNLIISVFMHNTICYTYIFPVIIMPNELKSKHIDRMLQMGLTSCKGILNKTGQWTIKQRRKPINKLHLRYVDDLSYLTSINMREKN